MHLTDAPRPSNPWDAEQQAAHARSDLSAGSILLYDFLAGQAGADGRLEMPWEYIVQEIRPNKESTVRGWRSELEIAGLVDWTWSSKGNAGFCSRGRSGGMLTILLRPYADWRPDRAAVWVRPSKPDPQQYLLFSSESPPALEVVPRTSPAGSDLTQVLAREVAREVAREPGLTTNGPANRQEGETPSSPACAAAHAPSNQTEFKPPPSTVGAPTAAAAAKETFEATAVRLVNALWPDGRGPISDRRDQRLIYRLTLLARLPAHQAWVRRWINETADRKARNPLAMLQALGPQSAPPGLDLPRLLSSIDVPAWALCSPRQWRAPERAANGEEPQRE